MRDRKREAKRKERREKGGKKGRELCGTIWKTQKWFPSHIPTCGDLVTQEQIPAPSVQKDQLGTPRPPKPTTQA